MSSSENPSPNPTRQLPDQPSMEQLAKQAKELLKSVRAEDDHALAEVQTFEREPDFSKFRLSDAQRVLARSYGYISWRQLRRFVDGRNIEEFCDAVSAGDVSRVRELVEVRPELVDIDRGDEQIALHIPVLAQDLEMTKLLMELGSNARRGFWPHREATSAYAIAKERGYQEILEVIESFENRKEVTPRSSNAAIDVEASKSAVASGNVDEVIRLHESGRLANEIDFYQGGLLSIAVRENNFEMLKLLIECDLDIDERATQPVGNGFSHSWGMPLHHASTHGRHDMAKWLIVHGCDVNAVVHGCGDALSNADESMREILLNAGARITVEHVAGWRDIELAHAIIDGTAPAQSLNSSAKQTGDGRFNPEIIWCFLWTATYHGVPEIVERCLEVIDWQIDESSWHYVLMQPFRFGNIPADERTDDVRKNFFDCMTILLKHPVDPDVRMNGNTVLQHLATSAEPTEQERLVFAKLLLDAGASLTFRDTGTMLSTPLGWAARWGRLDLVRHYLERGADVAEAGSEDWAKPIERARSNGHDEVVELLTNHMSDKT